MFRSALGPTLGPLGEGPDPRHSSAVTISAADTFASSIALAFGVLDAAGPADVRALRMPSAERHDPDTTAEDGKGQGEEAFVA